jgi:predicted ATPase
MKIRELHIEGFRSLKNVSWRPGDINLVIGPNASGKSNLLKALDALGASAAGRLGEWVRREGGMTPLRWNGVAEKITFRLETTPVDSNIPEERGALTYAFDMLPVGASNFRIEGEELSNRSKVDTGERADPFKFLLRTPQGGKFFHETERRLISEPSMPDEATLLSLAASPLFTQNRHVTSYCKNLLSWRIHQDLQTHRDAEIRKDAIASYETTLAPDGRNFIPVLHTLYASNREFKRALNEAMIAAFGNDFEELVFPPAADQRIQMRIRWRSLDREMTAAEMSDGTLRFLFLIAILANPDPPPLIAIDEPETGLHPAMLPVVAEHAEEAAMRTQLVFTTHSVDFLDAFQSSRPTVTVARWEDGETKLDAIEGDRLASWLEDYSLGGLFRSGTLEGMAQ